MDKLVCYRAMWSFKVGEQYDYWTNFGGLNHLVRDCDEVPYPFDGPLDDEKMSSKILRDTRDRLYIFDYFMTVQEWRDKQLQSLTLN